MRLLGGTADPEARPAAVAVVHATAERVRLRVPAIRAPGFPLAAVRRALLETPGVLSAELRPLTGSVVVGVAPATTAGAVAATLGAAVAAAAASPSAGAPEGGDPEGGDPAPPADALRSGSASARPWHSREPADVIAGFGTDPERGLTEAEAEARLARHGPNRMPVHEPPSAASLLARQVSGAPVLLLAGSAAASIATGGTADAAATLAVVAVNAVIGFVTEGQAERAISALADPAGDDARVLRDGVETLRPVGALVPGDVLPLRAGIEVAADARVIESRSLGLDEASMTGESVPVEKGTAASPPDAPVGARTGMVHAGTVVAEGSGRAVVVATGRDTEAALVRAATLGASRPKARIEEDLDRLGRRLALASLVACGALFAIGRLRGYPPGPLVRDALALAVAAVPEGLPLVATTTLSLGVRRMARRGILIRDLRAVESLGELGTVCLDKTGTLTENRMEVVEALAGLAPVAPDDPALVPLGVVAALNNDAELADGAPSGSSPTERAHLALALRLGLDPQALRDRHPRLDTVERGPERPWMTVVHAGPERLTTVKGAPEAVIARSGRILDDGTERPLTEDDRARLLAANDRMAARPARVLAFARGTGGEATDLTFLGLTAMVDPIRAGARGCVASLHGAGIRTVLITGDQSATAAATARELDLAAGRPVRVMDSTALSELDPILLDALARDTDVFARVSSRDKRTIVEALQRAGQVVAMTGDGVNDAPALRAADVGIAMGRTGTGVARGVANVVIRDDELETLVDAVAQGRTIHRNIRRALRFLVTTNLSEILVTLAEAAHGPDELESPMELLWINLVTDVLPGLGLALAAADPDVMGVPPRERGEPILGAADFRRMGRDGAMIAAAALGVHLAGLARHGAGPQTRGMTFLTLALGQLLYAFALVRPKAPVSASGLLGNRALDGALLASGALAVAPFFLPGLRRLLGIAPLPGRDVALAVAAAALPVSAVFVGRALRRTAPSDGSPRCATSS